MTKELEEFCHKVARDIWERGYIYVAKDDEELSRSLDDVAAILSLHLANFPRSSQNQTVSGGVSGTHEGTTADKSGSREPEKLNNAHEEEAEGACIYCAGRGPLAKLRDALAESSLSSPPSREHQCVSANDCPLCGNPEIGGMKNV